MRNSGKKIRPNERGREGGRLSATRRGRAREREGEGEALTSCGNTHFSHELIQTRKVTYSIPNTHGEKGSTHTHTHTETIHPMLSRSTLLKLEKSVHTAADPSPKKNNKKVLSDKPQRAVGVRPAAALTPQ